MKILVTGSSGFIGKRLTQALIDSGYKVLGIDIRQPATQPTGFSFHNCNILDSNELVCIVTESSPDAIIHLAARTDLNEKKNLQGYDANITGVENLITATQSTPTIKRCIFTSSQLVCKTGHVPIDDHEYCPNTLYGESKVLTEKIVRQRDGGGTKWCLVRPTTVWGPGMQAHYQRFFHMIKTGRYFHIGDKPLYKSYSYIGNIAHQYIKLLEAPVEQIHHKTLYLADYEPISLHEWANAFQHKLGAKPIRTYPVSLARIAAHTGDLVNTLGFRAFPFNSFRLNNILTEYQFNLSETKKICGPLPYTTDQGVNETVDWLLTLEN